MSKKRAPGRARAPQARQRDKAGRFLSARQIAALKGARTRAGKARAKAAKHGERARVATDRKLTAAQREARRKDARRVTQKIRRSKKAERGAEAIARPSSRSISSPRLKVHSKPSKSKPQPSTEVTIGTGDKFAAQISVRFQMPAGFKPTQELVREAILHKIETGEDAPRVKTKILRWRNPGRRMSEDRAWRQGNQDDAWFTLGNVIRGALAVAP